MAPIVHSRGLHSVVKTRSGSQVCRSAGGVRPGSGGVPPPPGQRYGDASATTPGWSQAPRPAGGVRSTPDVPPPGQRYGDASATTPAAYPPQIPRPSQVQEFGERIMAWTSTPFDSLAFVPRLAAGAALSFPSNISKLGSTMQELQDVANAPVSDATKQNILMTKAEDSVLEMLEMGAFMEADVLDQVRSAVPADVASQIPVTQPPATTAPPSEDYPGAAGPLSTSSDPVVTDLSATEYRF